MTFAKIILLLLLSFNCQAQFLPMIGHTAGATNVVKVDILPQLWMTNGLFAYWGCNDTNSSRVSDGWGTNHLYFRSATNVSLTNGILGNAVNVGAANSAGELTNNASGMTFKTFTLSWWIYPKSISGATYIYLGSNSTSRAWNQSSSWGAFANPSLRIVLTNTTTALSSMTFNLNEWRHFSLVYSNDVGRVWGYMDGRFIQSVTCGPINMDILPTSFSAFGQADFGAKDEIAIWSRGLEPWEVQLLAQPQNWRDYPKQYR